MFNERLLSHEMKYRGKEAIEKLACARMTLCGAGAVGSLLADNLVRQGVSHLRVIDCDRVEEQNVGTQLFDRADVGGWKVDLLCNRLFRSCEVEIEAVRKRLDSKSVKRLLKGSDLVIDAFDKAESRRVVKEYCATNEIPCLHVGLFEDYLEVIWNENYRVPADMQDADVCEYPLARNLVLLAVATASEMVMAFIIEGISRDVTGTLRDLQLNKLENCSVSK